MYNIGETITICDLGCFANSRPGIHHGKKARIKGIKGKGSGRMFYVQFEDEHLDWVWPSTCRKIQTDNDAVSKFTGENR